MKRFPPSYLENFANKLSSVLNTTPAGLASKLSLLAAILAACILLSSYVISILANYDSLIGIGILWVICTVYYVNISLYNLEIPRFNIVTFLLMITLFEENISFEPERVLHSALPGISVFLLSQSISLWVESIKIHRSDLKTLENGGLPIARLQGLNKTLLFFCLYIFAFSAMIVAHFNINLQYSLLAVVLLIVSAIVGLSLFLLAVIPRPPTRKISKMFVSRKLAVSGI